MIHYALICHDCDARFEAWFGSSKAYDEQSEAGLLECPECSGSHVGKQIMAPAVSGTKKTEDGKSVEAFNRFAAKARQHIDKNFDYVGRNFADEARAMHDGTIDARPVWGEATPAEQKSLREEGVAAAPLPAAFVPRQKPDDKDVN